MSGGLINVSGIQVYYIQDRIAELTDSLFIEVSSLCRVKIDTQVLDVVYRFPERFTMAKKTKTDKPEVEPDETRYAFMQRGILYLIDHNDHITGREAVVICRKIYDKHLKKTAQGSRKKGWPKNGKR